MRGIARLAAVLLLALATCGALPGAAAPFGQDLSSANSTSSSTETPTPTDDGIFSTVDDTTNDTVDAADDTINNTTDTVDGTTNDTLNSTSGTLDDTTDTIDDTTNDTLNDTTDTVDDTSNDTLRSTGSTLDDTTDTIDSTTTTTLESTNETVDGTTDLLDTTVSPLIDDDMSISNVLGGNATALVKDDEPMLGPDRAETDGSTALPDDLSANNPESSTRIASDDSALAIVASSGPSTRQIPADPGPLASGATAVTGVGAVAVGTMLGSSTVVEREVTSRVAKGLERLIRMVAPFRYSKYDGSDPLEHQDRAAIHDYVIAHPGAYVTAVSEAVGIPHSTARHHVKVLKQEGLVEDAKVRGRRRLFPAHSEQQELAAAMTDEATAAILDAIARLGPCSGTALAEELDRSVGTVSHHLSRLEEASLVVREKDGRTTVNRLPADVQEALGPEQDVSRPDTPPISAD